LFAIRSSEGPGRGRSFVENSQISRILKRLQLVNVFTKATEIFGENDGFMN